MKNVICMKWGTKFSPEYVNILESRVRKNVTGECRFVSGWKVARSAAGAS